MKYKCVMVVALSVFACFGGIATNSPLSLLRNKWGKGSIVDFRKVAYENLPLLFDGVGISAGSRMVRRTVTPWDDGTTGFNKLGGDN